LCHPSRLLLFPYTTLFRSIQLGGWWKLSLGVITPIVLGYMMFGLLKLNILKEHTDSEGNIIGNYEGYSDMFTLTGGVAVAAAARSEEHTSELQSRENLVCR